MRQSIAVRRHGFNACVTSEVASDRRSPVASSESSERGDISDFVAAAFDLKCTPEQLEVTELGSKEIAGVSGCGRRVRYVFIYGQGLWIANATSN